MFAQEENVFLTLKVFSNEFIIVVIIYDMN